MNSNLAEVKKQLEEHQKEVERLEREARTLKIQKKLELFMSLIAGDDAVSKFLEKHTVEETRVVAETFIMNFEQTLEQAEEKFKEIRAKKDRRRARKNNQASRQEMVDADDPFRNSDEQEEETNVIY
ncbi:MAG: hypothetical protein Q4G61_11240 [Tissierellia bacterium]|nr:hypothetical protein [Tissierellia bacterium]